MHHGKLQSRGFPQRGADRGAVHTQQHHQGTECCWDGNSRRTTPPVNLPFSFTELSFPHHLYHLPESFHVSHGIIHRVVVMLCLAHFLPALGVTPVPVESCPEVADSPRGMPKGIADSCGVKQSCNPHEVVRRIV